jgi:hypothetical protein
MNGEIETLSHEVFFKTINNRDIKGLGLLDMFDKIEFCGHHCK